MNTRLHHTFSMCISITLLCSGCRNIDALWADIPPYVADEASDSGTSDANGDAADAEVTNADANDATHDADSADDANSEVGPDVADSGDDARISMLDAPQNLRVTDTSLSIVLDWDDVDGAQAYELQIDGSGWVRIGPTSSHEDTEASQGTLAGGLTAHATSGTVREHVALTGTSTAVGVAGVSRTYTVRAVADGLVSPPSLDISAAIDAPTDIALSWEFASPDDPTNFTAIPNANALDSADVDASPAGGRRIYRLVANSDATNDTLVSNTVEGWRLAALQVVTGDRHSCALLSNGKVKCWGRGVVGQLGYGDTADRGGAPGDMPTPDVNIGFDVVKLYAGSYSVCAQSHSGSVRCWGNSTYAALGTGSLEIVGDQPSDMPPSDLQTGGVVVDLHSHLFATCAALSSGDVKCWGDNAQNHLGIGNFSDAIGDMAGEMPPASLNTGSSIQGVALAEFMSCAIDSLGDVRCWGGVPNMDPRFGFAPWPDEIVEDLPGSFPPERAATSRNATKLSLASTHACTINESAQLSCWGENERGQLGTGDTSVFPNSFAGTPISPRPILLSNTNLSSYFTQESRNNPGGFAEFSDVAVTRDSTCALTTEGAVVCSGLSTFTNLTTDENTFKWLNLGRAAVSLSTSSRSLHYCAVMDNGTVKCWGVESNGRLGNESLPLDLTNPSQHVELW